MTKPLESLASSPSGWTGTGETTLGSQSVTRGSGNRQKARREGVLVLSLTSEWLCSLSDRRWSSSSAVIVSGAVLGLILKHMEVIRACQMPWYWSDVHGIVHKIWYTIERLHLMSLVVKHLQHLPSTTITVSVVAVAQLLCQLNWATTQPGVQVRQQLLFSCHWTPCSFALRKSLVMWFRDVNAAAL